MAKKWVCDTCLVPNDLSDEVCSCCGSSNNLSGIFKNQTVSDLPNQNEGPHLSNFLKSDQKDFKFEKSEVANKEIEEKVKLEDSKNRLRLEYTPADLNHTAVFVVGSSEIDQLPSSCCDMTPKHGTGEKLSMYECSMPTPILTLPKVKITSVSCGALHTALLSSTGSVFTFGCNDMGALGRPSMAASKVGGKEAISSKGTNGSSEFYSGDSEPTMLDLKFKVKKVTCGDNHTLFLSFTGSVYFTGCFKDSYGHIGIADYGSYDTLRGLEFVTEPVRVPCEGTIVDISSGENHCVLLCQGGNSLYTFGSNEFSQLLVWDDMQNPTDEEVDLSLESNRKLVLTWPQSRKVGDILSVVSSAPGGTQEANSGYSEGKSDNSGVETTKNKKVTPRKGKMNNEVVKENNTPEPRTRGTKRGRPNADIITQIFTGYCTTFFQTKSLKLYGAGRNAQGEVGVGSEELVVEYPTELAFFRGVELTSLTGGQFFTMALVNNYVFIWGKLCYLGISDAKAHLTAGSLSSESLEPVNLSDSYNTSYTGYKDGRAYGHARRYNTKYDLYDEEPLTSSKRRRVYDYGMLEMDNLDVMEKLLHYDYSSGYSNAVKCGKATTPLLLPHKGSFKSIFNGSDSLFALTYDDDLYSWGSSQNYILGNGKDVFYQNTPELVPQQAFSICKVIQGAGGSQHTVFLAMKKKSIYVSH